MYYSSLETGPEHIDTAGGYYYMADVFLKQESIESALALFDKVVDIWYKFLLNLRHRPEESISDYLSEAHIGEAAENLRAVLDTRKRCLGRDHIATGEAAYTLGILKHVTGFEADARRRYKSALRIYDKQLGPEHDSSQAIRRALLDLSPSAELEEASDDEHASPAAAGKKRKKKRSSKKQAGAGAALALATAIVNSGPAPADAAAASAGQEQQEQGRRADSAEAPADPEDQGQDLADPQDYGEGAGAGAGAGAGGPGPGEEEEPQDGGDATEGVAEGGGGVEEDIHGDAEK